ncbi:MAG: GxxExxY protein [Kiritimatiellia bacterium]
MELLHKEITEQVIGAAYEVYKILGYGFLEKVYQRAMVVELQKRGLKVVTEAPADVFFKDVRVGEYFADLLVEGNVVVELKVAGELNSADLAQMINELHAIRKEVGLLINFGRTGVEFRRAVNQKTTTAPAHPDPIREIRANP